MSECFSKGPNKMCGKNLQSYYKLIPCQFRENCNISSNFTFDFYYGIWKHASVPFSIYSCKNVAYNLAGLYKVNYETLNTTKIVTVIWATFRNQMM